LINNGIHAGEPDGIDATMQLFRDLALGKIKVPQNTIISTIPIYNIGGAKKFDYKSKSRRTRNIWFRGNGRNYDLNRDFIKSDTKNTKSLRNSFTNSTPMFFMTTM
jgi:hypothetical protein